MCRAKPFRSVTRVLINVLKGARDTARGLKTAALLPVCGKDRNYQHGTPVMRSTQAASCPVHAGFKRDKSFSIRMGRERKLNYWVALRSARDSRAGHTRGPFGFQRYLMFRCFNAWFSAAGLRVCSSWHPHHWLHWGMRGKGFQENILENYSLHVSTLKGFVKSETNT